MKPPSPRAGSYQPVMLASAVTMLDPGVSGVCWRSCRSPRSGRGPRSCRSLRGGRSLRSGRGPRSLRGAFCCCCGCGGASTPSVPSRKRLRPRPRRRWKRPRRSLRSPACGRSPLRSGPRSGRSAVLRSGAAPRSPPSKDSTGALSTRGVSTRGVSTRGVSTRGVSVGAAAEGRSARSARGARGARGSRGSRAAATTGGLLATSCAAGGAGGASAGAASATTVFFGRPRGFFTGASSRAGVGVGAVTTAAGASPLSLYGFGSSPCAVLRGERGPRPGEGRRRSVMSSMCYVVTGHGAVRNHRRARRTHGGVAPLRTLMTSPATPSGTMRGPETVMMKKSGRV